MSAARCPRCGYTVPRGASSCSGCQLSLTTDAAEAVRPFALARTPLLSTAGWLDVTTGAVSTGIALLVLAFANRTPPLPADGARLSLLRSDPTFRTILTVLFAYGAFMLVAGIGVLRLRPWGRAMRLLTSAASLPLFPVGTVAGVVILRHLLDPAARLLFSRRALADLSAPDVEALEEMRRSPQRQRLVALMLALLLVPLVVGGSTVLVAVLRTQSLLPPPEEPCSCPMDGIPPALRQIERQQHDEHP